MGNIKLKKKIFDIVLNVFAWLSFFVAVILALSVLFSALSSTDSQNGRSVFGHRMLIVNSDSMSKSGISEDEDIFFTSNDLIIIKEVDDVSDIEIGDVITFVSCNPESVGETVSHKVRDIKTTDSGKMIGFETYGISTGVSDPAVVEPSTVIGKYVFKIPRLGNIFRFFKQPAGFFVSILVPCLLLLIFFSIKVGKQIAKREMSDSYDAEIESLKERISQMEKEGLVVQETNLNDQPIIEPEQEKHIEPERPQIQEPMCSEKMLELSFKALSTTIESLTHTIESLAITSEKPIETLSRTVETLSEAITRPDKAEIEEPEPIPEPEPEEVKEPAPEEPMPEKLSFNKELFLLDNETRRYFGDVHNELVSYKKVRYLISHKGIYYKVGKNTIAKMTVQDSVLKLYLALNVKDHPKALIIRENAPSDKVYKDMFFAMELKSNNRRNNAIKLVNYLAKNHGLMKDELFRLFRNKNNIFEQLRLFE